MHRDPDMSYRGALRVLGRGQPRALEAADKALGGVILAGPLLGATVASPLTALWGWVDQKRLAVELVHQLYRSGLTAVRGATDYQRHELLKAAHTIIVCTAFFESLAEVIGPAYQSLEVTEREKIHLIGGGRDAATTVELLYESPVPLPTAAAGFEELATDALPAFYTRMTDAALKFFGGLAAWPRARQHMADPDNVRQHVAREAIRRYRSLYVALATDVPEFATWTGLQEHAATRRQIADVRHALADTERRPASLLDPPYQPLSSNVPEVWLLQPRFGVVPYVGRADLLADLEAWCGQNRPFSIAVVAGEGGSGKTRLAAELCTRMHATGWDAGFALRTTALTELVPESSTLLVVDYPERWLAVLGAALERLASHAGGPRTRVLLLARQPAEQSHWWADLDRASHRTTSLFTTLRCDLAEHALSPPERQEHVKAAVQAFSGHLGVKATAVPDVTDDAFANPLLVHVAALLAVHGQRGGPDSPRPVREDVLAHLLAREQGRWSRLLTVHRLDDLHDTHALRAVLAGVLTAPSPDEVDGLLAGLSEFSEPMQRERRARIGYWLAELYPGEALLASFGPDLLVEELLDTAARGTAGLDGVIAAIHRHPATTARHRSRLLTTLRLAAERRPAVHAALHRHLATNLPALVEQALDDTGGLLATALDNALVHSGERKDPELKLALACADLQTEAPTYHERGAQLLSTTMRLALPLFRAMAQIDPDNNLDVLIVGLSQLIHRYQQAGRDEEALALNLECVQVRRQLVARDPDHVADLSFDLGNLAAAHIMLGQHQDALAAAEEAVALLREGKGDTAKLALALHRAAGVQAELGNYAEALAANTEALPVLRRLADQHQAYYLPLLAEALGVRGAILTAQDRYQKGLAATSEAIELRERLAEQRPDKYLPSLQYDLHNLSRVNADLGQYPEALAAAERAVTVSRQLATANPRRYRFLLIRNLYQLAQIHLQLTRPDDAIATAEEAVDIGRQGTESDLAVSLSQFSDVLTKSDRFAEALPVCREAVALLRPLTDTQPGQLRRLVATLTNLSQVLGELDQLDEALTAAQDAAELAQRLHASDHFTRALAAINLGDRYARLERMPQALEHTQVAVDLLRPAHLPAALARALAKLADRRARLQQRDEALAAALEAVQLGEKVHHANPSPGRLVDLAFALKVLSDIHLSFGRPEDGLQPLIRAVQLNQELAKADPDRHMHGLAAALHSLANIQVATGRYAEAVSSCWRGSLVYEHLANAGEDRYLGPLVGSLRDLRGCLVTAGQLEDAVLVAHRQVEAVDRLAAKDPAFCELLAQSYSELAGLLSLIGQFTEAQRMMALAQMHQQAAIGEGP